MVNRVGFACIGHSLGLTTNHTTVLKRYDIEKAKHVITQNLDDLDSILSWMLTQDERLRMFRLGAEFVPFASHETITSCCAIVFVVFSVFQRSLGAVVLISVLSGG